MISSTFSNQIRNNFLSSLSHREVNLNLDNSDLNEIERLLDSKSQSFLFEAQPGAATELARYFFALLNCPQYACSGCPLCETAFLKAHPDFIIVAPEGSEIVRRQVVEEVLRFAYETPVIVGRKLIVIEEAHLLNIEASNALLKVVEEPPASTFFVFVTEKPDMLLPTIISRLTRIRLKSNLTQVKDAVVYTLLRDFVISLRERKALHNLDKKLKEIIDRYAQEEAAYLKEKINFLSKIDFDSKTKKRIVSLENQKYERLKKKYELELASLFFFKLKHLLHMVIEMKSGGTSFLDATPQDIEIFDVLKKYDMEIIIDLAQIVDAAIEMLAYEVKPEQVLKGAILKSWMVVY
ncbi:MAG: hypothetical protein N2440_03365 [Actinobacteria bacterium]|nr:hypothetical protein [Actinomycetota bacterium]